MVIAALVARSRIDHQQGDWAIVENLATAGGTDRAKLEAWWRSGTIAQRRLALQFVADRRRTEPPFQSLWKAWLPEAVSDIDEEVRTRALGELGADDGAPARQALWANLHDIDPEIRRLAALDFRRVGDETLTPWMLPALGDPNPTVALAADATLRQWTGRDSGLRLALALPGQNPAGDYRDKIAAASRAWRDWYSSRFPVGNFPSVDPGPQPASSRRMAPQFTLKTLDKKTVSSTSLRGRPVLLNFWTTWCSGCREELPDLVEFYRRHSKEMTVLGISLDTPDAEPDPDGDSGPTDRRSAEEIRSIISKTVNRFHIAYPIALDPQMEVGRAYLGGELPANVWIDAEGRLVRRYLGSRSLETMELMLAEASAVSQPK